MQQPDPRRYGRQPSDSPIRSQAALERRIARELNRTNNGTLPPKPWLTPAESARGTLRRQRPSR